LPLCVDLAEDVVHELVHALDLGRELILEIVLDGGAARLLGGLRVVAMQDRVPDGADLPHTLVLIVPGQLEQAGLDRLP